MVLVRKSAADSPQILQANSLGSCTMARRLDWGDETSYMREPLH